MKTTLTSLILFTLFSLSAFAQDYTGWSLPDGAKARLGKGSIHEVQYSPDGARLAVAGSIGIWLYDARTGAELSLLTGHTGDVDERSVQPGWSHACQWELGQYRPSLGCSDGGARCGHWKGIRILSIA